ncbi:MAG: thioredoxin family protein [Deltaproteobacteria bacterium]|nr:thioredoxin family protein [Deltaproteobacteria bacterium]
MARLAPRLALLAALCLPALARAGTSPLQWVDSSFAEALARAETEKKPLMVDVYATWCGPCHLLDRNVFTDEVVLESSKAWIAVKLDGELGEGLEVAKRYHVVGFPTVLFLDPSGKEIDRIFGYVEPAAFAATMEAYREGRDTLDSAAEEALKAPADLEAALEVGTRYAVRGDAGNAYRHFARILEARQRLLEQGAREKKVATALQLLTGDPLARPIGAQLAGDLVSKEEREKIDGLAAQAYLVLGKYLFLRGRRDNRRALKILQALEREFPESSQAREAPYHIAVALQRSRKSAEAKKKLQSYLTAEKHSAEAANTVAWFCYRERAHLDWGKEVARKALEAEPQNGALWDTLAELEGALGNWKAALEAAKQAAAADPSEPYYGQQVTRFEYAVSKDG